MLKLRTTSAAVVVALTLCSMPLAAQNFEGTVVWAMGGKADKTMTQSYKAGKVRTEMNGGMGNMVMLMDASMTDMTMLMTGQKMYMKVNMKKAMDEHMKDGMKEKQPKITDTGKTETIAGKSCNVYRYAEEAGKPETMEMCAAKGLGFFMMGSGGGPMGGKSPLSSVAAAASNPEYAKLYKDGFFPLRITDISKGKPETVMQVTSIEQKPVPASAFEIPAGYSEMKMPSLGRPQ